MEENTDINGDTSATVKQDIIADQSSHDLEAGSHDHSHTLDVHIDTGNHKKDVHIDTGNHKKLSVNGLSYRRLLEKEELEDCEDNTIVMEDLAVETSDVIVRHNNGRPSKFMVKLKLVRDNAVSTFLIFLSLLK